jgi:hypothetical protein
MFETGTRVFYRHFSGVVNFVDKKYITITISRGDHKSSDCNILVYVDQFENVVIEDSK